MPERRQSAEDYDAPVTSSMTGSEFRTAAMRAAVVGVPARGGRANTPPRVLAALAASPLPSRNPPGAASSPPSLSAYRPEKTGCRSRLAA